MSLLEKLMVGNAPIEEDKKIYMKEEDVYDIIEQLIILIEQSEGYVGQFYDFDNDYVAVRKSFFKILKRKLLKTT